MAFPTTGILDNFNRADSASLGANWTTGWLSFGTASLQIISNTIASATSPANTNTSNYWSASTFGPDSEAYITIPTYITTDNQQIVLGLRLQQPGTGSTTDGYYIENTLRSGTDRQRVYRLDNEAFTLLGADINTEFAAGDAFGADIIGSTINVYRQPSGGSWGSIANRTDSTYGSAGNIGINLDNGVTPTNAVRLDDFGGGTVVLPPPPTANIWLVTA